MNVIESIVKVGDTQTEVRLQCGCHARYNNDNGVKPGCAAFCEACDDRRSMGLPHPDVVLDKLVEDYVITMQAQGHVIGANDRVAIRRAAGIQYAWYCAFKRVLP